MTSPRLPFRAATCAVLIAMIAVTAHASPVVTQMGDDSPASANGLVDTLLSGSSNLTVVAGSVTYTGQSTASGTFTNGGTDATGLGIDNGVVLTSGDARFIGSSADFPGDSANKSLNFTSGIGNALTENTSGGSALFNGMTSESTTNASVLGFSFVPQGDHLQVQFAYGSEDYGWNVGTGFPTDVMGIFVNGVNYALTSSGNAISASSVNCLGGDCAAYRDNPTFSGTIDTEMNGMTTVFSLSIPVMSGQTNSIAFGVADTFDGYADSALMLRAGSIAAVPEPSSIALLLAGLGAIGLTRRQRARVHAQTPSQA